MLGEFADFLNRPDSAVRSVRIARRGRPVFHYQRRDIDVDAAQPVNSVTKSVLGLLLGLAVHHGRVGLDDSIALSLPEAGDPGMPAGLTSIQVRHLATMTSGFVWNERQLDPLLMHACPELGASGRLRWILQRQLAHPPGQHFEYDSHGAHLLSLLLNRVCDGDLPGFAQRHLFDPLAIAPPRWDADENGVPFGGRGLHLRITDLLHLGMLMAQDGVWQGKPLLDAGYMRASRHLQSRGKLPLDGSHTGYGYLWWVDVARRHDPEVFAAGFGEQYILLEPRLGLVAATLADSNKTHKYLHRWWKTHVCGAVCD